MNIIESINHYWWITIGWKVAEIFVLFSSEWIATIHRNVRGEITHSYPDKTVLLSWKQPLSYLQLSNCLFTGPRSNVTQAWIASLLWPRESTEMWTRRGWEVGESPHKATAKGTRRTRELDSEAMACPYAREPWTIPAIPTRVSGKNGKIQSDRVCFGYAWETCCVYEGVSEGTSSHSSKWCWNTPARPNVSQLFPAPVFRCLEKINRNGTDSTGTPKFRNWERPFFRGGAWRLCPCPVSLEAD